MSRPERLGCLLDEDLDPALAQPLADALERTVTTVRAQGWLGVKNGPLLQAMADEHLQVLITGDRELYRRRQAQVIQLGIRIVLIRDPARALERIQEIAAAVVRVRIGELLEVASS